MKNLDEDHWGGVSPARRKDYTTVPPHSAIGNTPPEPAPPRKFWFEAILPDIAPSLTNSSLFALEKAVRSSVVLGLVGAGGIGQELKVAFDLFQYRNASAIILVIFVIVLAMELITDKLRARIQ